MCDNGTPADLDAAAVRAIAASRGVSLSPAEAAEVLAPARRARAALAALVARLHADDDIHAFRHILAGELPR